MKNIVNYKGKTIFIATCWSDRAVYMGQVIQENPEFRFDLDIDGYSRFLLTLNPEHEALDFIGEVINLKNYKYPIGSMDPMKDIMSVLNSFVQKWGLDIDAIE